MFVRYVIARAKAQDREETFRNYVTESLFVIMENQARSPHGGKMLNAHYCDIGKPSKPEPTGEDILNDLVQRGALEVVNGNT